MPPNDVQYYRERARIERARATQAKSKAATQVHLELASLYDRLVPSEAPKPALDIVSEMRPTL